MVGCEPLVTGLPPVGAKSPVTDKLFNLEKLGNKALFSIFENICRATAFIFSGWRILGQIVVKKCP